MLFLQKSKIPDNKVVRVDLLSTAAVQQDPRVSHNGAAPVMLVLHGGHGWQKTVEIFWDVSGAVAIKNIVDDIAWLQGALENRDVSLRVEESQNIFPVKREDVYMWLWKAVLGGVRGLAEIIVENYDCAWWGWRGSCWRSSYSMRSWRCHCSWEEDGSHLCSVASTQSDPRVSSPFCMRTGSDADTHCGSFKFSLVRHTKLGIW